MKGNEITGMKGEEKTYYLSSFIYLYISIRILSINYVINYTLFFVLMI